MLLNLFFLMKFKKFLIVVSLECFIFIYKNRAKPEFFIPYREYPFQMASKPKLLTSNVVPQKESQ